MRTALYFVLASMIMGAVPAGKVELTEGNPSSPVRVLIYEDLQCSDCGTLRRLLDEKLLPRYGSKVAFVHRDFPLARHPWARQAAVAGRWVYEQNHDLGILFRQQILAEQANLGPETLKKWLLEFASRNNLDQKGILDSLKDPRLNGIVEQDFLAGTARGIQKTPTVIINGTPFVELIIFDDVARCHRSGAGTIERMNAIVTGASRGIGRGIAAELARDHKVLATYLGSIEKAQSLREETGTEIFRCDISSANDRENLVRHARELFHEGLDLLVNNAGIAPRERRDVLDATEESFDELIGTNLKGPHFLTQNVARWMLEGGRRENYARIVFISSISAFTASVNRAEYCISKAGESMSRMVYAQRLAAEGILVFEIQPGVIRTDMIAKVESVYEQRIANGLLPQARMGEPADIARVVRAIADGHLDYCAGQVIHADGGFHLRSL